MRMSSYSGRFLGSPSFYEDLSLNLFATEIIKGLAYSMDWDWEAQPTYKSERIGVDRRFSPVVLYDMKQPRLLEDDEVDLMLSIADLHLDRGQPFVALVRHQPGTGVIGARHRKAFSDWLDLRRDELKRDDVALVVVVPEAIFRAVLRVVYRFRTPPIRTITVSDLDSAAAAIRGELLRTEQPISGEIGGFLSSLSD